MLAVWVEAARPRTLPISIAPVIVGTAAAGDVAWLRFIGVLTVSVGLQVGVNLANDYFDAVKGVDTPDRTGPRRVTAAGLVSRARMRVGIGIALGAAAVAGMLLSIAVGPELLVLGALCIIAALAYSGGPRPYASAGLGELAVFVFFGLVATAGTAYVHAERLRWLYVAVGVPLGALAGAVMVVNNLRDLDTDRRAGKRTLAVRLGVARTLRLYDVLVLGAFPAALVIAGLEQSVWLGLPWLAVPLVVDPVRRTHELVRGADRGDALGSSVRLFVAYSILLAIGLALG